MAQYTAATITSNIDTIIDDNNTQNITPADVRTAFAYLNVKDNATGLVAHAGGGQGSALALTTYYNSVDTCASDGDSVKLIAGDVSFVQKVYNSTNKLLSVFPQSGEKIDGRTNGEYTVFPGTLATFEAVAPGVWFSSTTINNS